MKKDIFDKLLENVHEARQISRNVEGTDTEHIILNQIRTPDGTVLTSRSVHDYIAYKDANGEVYIVDGGTCYLRRSVNKIPAEELSIYSCDSHLRVRGAFSWGTYGLNGDKPLKFVLVKDMSTEHIKAVLANCNLRGYINKIFEDELKYRKGELIDKSGV